MGCGGCYRDSGGAVLSCVRCETDGCYSCTIDGCACDGANIPPREAAD